MRVEKDVPFYRTFDRKKPHFNELYTTEEMAELFLIPYKKYFTKNKTIVCPCDTEDSEIVKWLTNNTKAKVIFFGDKDMNSEDARLIMNQADWVITNPPFTYNVFKPFLDWLIDNKKNFLIFGPNLPPQLHTERKCYEIEFRNEYPHTDKDGKLFYVRGKFYSNTNFIVKEKKV